MKPENPIQEKVEKQIHVLQSKQTSQRKPTQEGNLERSNPLSTEEGYIQHTTYIQNIGIYLCKQEGKEFIINENNRDILKFLVYYFNEDERALDIFPDMSLRKNILLVGKYGVGKTMLMKIFSTYLQATRNHRAFVNTSITQINNHYKIHSNIDAYTYNEIKSKKFEGNPFHICVNDIGLDSEGKHYGTQLKEVVDELLFARYEIYQNHQKYTHLTSNLDTEDLEEKFEGRLGDRFKNCNVVFCDGDSLR